MALLADVAAAAIADSPAAKAAGYDYKAA